MGLSRLHAALEFNELAARQDEGYSWELAESHSCVADAPMGLCELFRAMEHRLKSVGLAADHFSQDPRGDRKKADYADALSGLALAYQKSGLLKQAIETLQKSLDLQSGLVEEDLSVCSAPATTNRNSGRFALPMIFAGVRNELDKRAIRLSHNAYKTPARDAFANDGMHNTRECLNQKARLFANPGGIAPRQRMLRVMPMSGRGAGLRHPSYT